MIWNLILSFMNYGSASVLNYLKKGALVSGLKACRCPLTKATLESAPPCNTGGFEIKQTFPNRGIC